MTLNCNISRVFNIDLYPILSQGMITGKSLDLVSIQFGVNFLPLFIYCSVIFLSFR